MFKFGFTIEGETASTEESEEQGACNSSVNWLESAEIDPKCVKISADYQYNRIKRSNYEIKYLSIGDILVDLINKEEDDCSILAAEQNHSDLITAKYEGGLKIWECTYDLLNYIDDEKIDFTGKKVLDLGCGAGIIGMACAIKGATSVFQDYNSEVITSITIPNASINSLSFDRCAFYDGDWASFAKLIENKHKFDYILTSETIYNTDNYPKLIDLFIKLLKNDGTIYLAAKYYYFGVGGGIGQFVDLLKTNKKFSSSIVRECSNGVKRAILKITFT